MFGLHQSLRLELAQAFPTSLHMIQVPDGNLEEMLEELLADVKLHKAKNGAGNGGNLFDTASFSSVCARFSTPREVVPSYKASFDEQGMQVESLRDFTGVDRALSKYLAPPEERRSPEQSFSKRFKSSLDWKVQTQEKLVRYILACQERAIKTKNVHALQPLTYANLAEQVKVHPTTANRLLKDLWITLEGRELKASDFVMNGNSGLTQFQVQSYLLDLSREQGVSSLQDLSLSDQEITSRYNAQYQTSISRRLVNKARNILEKEFNLRVGTQKPQDHSFQPVNHWMYDRPMTKEDIYALASHQLEADDLKVLALPQQVSMPVNASAPPLETPTLWYHYLHTHMHPEQRTLFAQEIDTRAKKSGSYTSQDLDALKQSIEYDSRIRELYSRNNP